MKRLSNVAPIALTALAVTLPHPLLADWDITDTGQPYTETRLTLTEGTWMSLDVSPNGETIIFDLLGDIYTISAAGGNATLVHGGPAMQRSPKFSPDGQWITYLSDRDGADNIWISRADGTGARQISHETTLVPSAPAWNADGTAIAAARMFDTSDRLHDSEIVRYALSGGPGEVVVQAPETGENVHEVTFSPDGRTMIYTEKVTPQGQSVIYVDANHLNFAIQSQNLGTGETDQLIRGFGGAMTPTISPNGSQIAFIRRVRDRTVLFTYDRDTRVQRPIFDGLDRDGQADFLGQGAYYPAFEWFPDNRHIAIWWGGKLHRIDTETGAHNEIPFQAIATHRLTEPTRFHHELAPEEMRVRAITKIAPSPMSQAIAFSAIGHVWTQASPDSEPVRITDSTLSESDPVYSPDGSRLAFVQWSDVTGGSIRLRDANGHVSTVATGPGIMRDPVFTPDGATLLYRITPGDNCLGGHHAEPGLYAVPTSGGENRRLGEGGANLRVTADGSRIFFTTEDYVDGSMQTTLASIAIDGTDRRDHVLTDGSDTNELKISPDMQWLAFRQYQQYYVMPFDPAAETSEIATENARQISTIGGYELAWSRDSDALVFAIGPQVQRYRIGDDGVATDYAEINLTVPVDVPSGQVALTGGRIITMNDADAVIENGTVLLDGNRIAAVGPAGSIAIPNGTEIIDIAGRTVMPGLVDMHGHLDTCYYASSGLVPESQASRYAALAFGVTTNFDPYTSELQTLTMDEATQAGEMVGPRAISVGLVAYGRQRKYDPAYIPINAYEDALTYMARKEMLGIWAFKSYRQTMRAQRQMLVSAAREHGIMADLEGESNFYIDLTGILDGHMSVEHNMPMSVIYDDLIQLQSASRVAQTPTLVVLFGELMGENYLYQTTRSWDDPRVRRFVQNVTSSYGPLGAPGDAPPYVRGMTTVQADDSLYDIGFRSVSRSMNALDQAGALINVGSHGQVFGLAQHWEMWLLAEGGMAPNRVLRAATMNGATTLGVDDQIGSIEPGKLADIIVLDRNPLDDIRNSNSVRYTIVNGRVYDSETMNEAGNHPQPRQPFFWEGQDIPEGMEWIPAWAHN